MLFNGDVKRLNRVVKKFWRYVEKGNDNECWIWKGTINEHGYGVIMAARSFLIRAHRLSYSLSIGKPMDDHLCILHECDNPPCVNPRHLKAGTKLENTHDMIKKGRNSNPPINYGEKHHNTKFKESDFYLIKNDKRSNRIIAMEFGVCEETIRRVKTGKTWKLQS